MASDAIEKNEEPPRIEESPQTEALPKAEIHSRWKAGVLVPANMPVEECWAVFGDFANPQRFMTHCLESKVVEGEPNVINCVRYVKGAHMDVPEGSFWAKERLLVNDHENHIQTYTVEENSFGFVNYQAYLKVHRGNNNTSVITWSMEMDPLPGMTAPPNPVTKLLTDSFKLFIKHVESNFLRKKGMCQYFDRRKNFNKSVVLS